MSLKNVELQIAVPRTKDISRVQDEYQHKLVHGQQELLQEQKRIDERNRLRPQETGAAQQARVSKKKKENRQSNNENDSTNQKDAHEVLASVNRQSPHSGGHLVSMRDPMRGRHVDISL